jgi:phosphoglycerate dehydrogenase-like enzyme
MYTRIDNRPLRRHVHAYQPSKQFGHGAFDMSIAGPSTVHRPLRVHVQESLGSLDVFIVTEPCLRPLLVTRQKLNAELDISYGATRVDLDRGLRTAEVMLVGNFETDDLLRRAPRLKWIQSIFAGVEKLAPVIPSSITLTNGSGIHAAKAGEYGIGAIILLNTGFLPFIANQRRRVWQPIFTTGLAGKSVVFLGTGKLAAAVARHCQAFGMRVIGVNRQGQPAPLFDAVFGIDALPRALVGADFLVVTLPNTPDTQRIIGAREFAYLPKGAGLVSIGRGQVIDEAALAAALAAGHISGAVLDVFEKEPLPPESPLWGMENVVITPHCGVDDLSGYLPRALNLFLDNVERYLSGAPLENVVDLVQGY